jgi:hypothetical protein
MRGQGSIAAKDDDDKQHVVDKVTAFPATKFVLVVSVIALRTAMKDRPKV